MTDHAILRPSNVDVPLPISSRISRELFVAFFKILLTSVISTMKVERPLERSSDAPIRVKILSTRPIFAEVAGT